MPQSRALVKLRAKSLTQRATSGRRPATSPAKPWQRAGITKTAYLIRFYYYRLRPTASIDTPLVISRSYGSDCVPGRSGPFSGDPIDCVPAGIKPNHVIKPADAPPVSDVVDAVVGTASGRSGDAVGTQRRSRRTVLNWDYFNPPRIIHPSHSCISRQYFYSQGQFICLFLIWRGTC